MSIWSKIVGGSIGYAVGGPVGALVGVMGGHAVDHAIDKVMDTPDHKSVTLTIAIVALGAKMAKADGVVSAQEISAFRRVFIIDDADLKNVARVFDLAKQDTAGYELYAGQVYTLFGDSPAVLENLLWCLSHIARADGSVQGGEMEFLQNVSRIFKFSLSDFERITGLKPDGTHASPYEILGVLPSDSLDTINNKYRELARQNHPDILLAQGMPPEMVKGLQDKMADINTAMTTIKRTHPEQKAGTA